MNTNPQLKFRPDQLAIAPLNSVKAIALLQKIGLEEWAFDQVEAAGKVFGGTAVNTAHLAFNYEALADSMREFEVLEYVNGENWIHGTQAVTKRGLVSHLGMHVSERELVDWREFFKSENIDVAQEVETQKHTNPVIAGKRWYKYVIFNTAPILGVDLKFIVRHVIEQPEPEAWIEQDNTTNRVCRRCGYPIAQCVCSEE